MTTPIDDRPAHKGHPERSNRMGALLAECFDVPESVMRIVPHQFIPDLDLVGDLLNEIRESGVDAAIRNWGLEEIDPRLCGLCMGEACEFGCGRRKGGGCHQGGGGFGPNAHRVCTRCGGSGRVEVP